MKSIAILGSTGSIGRQTLEVVRRNPDKFCVRALVANTNIDLLLEQAEEFKPEYVATSSIHKYSELKSRAKCKVFEPVTALTDAVGVGPDVVVVACTGINGLRPTMLALEKGIDVAIANKETLVTAGHIVNRARKKSKSRLFPVDSEHSAVWQSLNSNRPCDVESIILTASGGAFRNLTREEIAVSKASRALKHPNWVMGRKITIDCATLMNKGLEIIEAKHLFEVEADKIKAVMHPESIIHSMVSYVDGAVIAELSNPSMVIPISYALTYPDRLNTGVQALNFADMANLTFKELDRERFPCLKIAEQVARSHPTYAVVMNAANDVMVDEYINGKAGFYDISDEINRILDEFLPVEVETVQDVEWLDEKIRTKVRNRLTAK